MYVPIADPRNAVHRNPMTIPCPRWNRGESCVRYMKEEQMLDTIDPNQWEKHQALDPHSYVPSKISKTTCQCNNDCFLKRRPSISRTPRKHDGYSGKYATGRKESASVADTRVLLRTRRIEHGVADNTEQGTAHDKRPPFLEPIGEHSNPDRTKATKGVWGDGEAIQRKWAR